MARPRRSEQTREALIERGIEELSQHGYHGTGIKQILDAVKVPKGSFYNYFSSKEAFVAEILQEYSARILRQLDEYLDQSDDSPMQKLKTIYGYMLTKYADEGCQRGCLIGSLAAEMGNQSESCQRAMLQSLKNWKRRIVQIMREAQQAGEVRADMTPEALAMVFWSSWEGSLLQMKIEGSIDSASEVLSILLDQLLQIPKVASA